MPIDHPDQVVAWSTRALGGGVWAPSGVASDGTAIFAATGNTFGASIWSDGNAIIRLGPDLLFTRASSDFFTPSNWKNLDDHDLDLGGVGPLVVDLAASAHPSGLLAFGKNGVVYLLDRANLGGIGRGNGAKGEGLASAMISDAEMVGSAAAFTTATGLHVAVRTWSAVTGELRILRIDPTETPTIAVAWSTGPIGSGAPIATVCGGEAPIVWSYDRCAIGTTWCLVGYDGATGEVVFAGGAAADTLPGFYRYSSPIVAHGRIFLATDAAVLAFSP